MRYGAKTADFYSLFRLVTMNLGQGNQNLINSSLCHNNIIISKFWSECIFALKRKRAEIWTFKSVAVTLKIRLSSTKSNQLFPLFKQHASLDSSKYVDWFRR